MRRIPATVGPGWSRLAPWTAHGDDTHEAQQPSITAVDHYRSRRLVDPDLLFAAGSEHLASSGEAIGVKAADLSDGSDPGGCGPGQFAWHGYRRMTMVGNRWCTWAMRNRTWRGAAGCSRRCHR